MSKPPLFQFLDLVDSREDLQREFEKNASADNPDWFIALGKQSGFQFTADEIHAWIAQDELSDADLDSVAGGLSFEALHSYQYSKYLKVFSKISKTNHDAYITAIGNLKA